MDTLKPGHVNGGPYSVVNTFICTLSKKNLDKLFKNVCLWILPFFVYLHLKSRMLWKICGVRHKSLRLNLTNKMIQASKFWVKTYLYITNAYVYTINNHFEIIKWKLILWKSQRKTDSRCKTSSNLTFHLYSISYVHKKEESRLPRILHFQWLIIGEAAA